MIDLAGLVWFGLAFFFFFGRFIELLVKRGFYSVGWDPCKAVCGGQAFGNAGGFSRRPRRPCCQPLPSLPGWLLGMNVPPPPVYPSVSLHVVCLSRAQPDSTVRDSGFPALSSRAATLAVSPRVGLSVPPCCSVPLAMQGPSCLLRSPHLSLSLSHSVPQPLPSDRGGRLQGREHANPLLSLSLFSPSVSS